jgi:7-carboxy-7-deazaguanine synthase (Cx14CxxC type)
MGYTVKEIFCSIQGEGHNAGRVAVFCRFAGCNLWSGLECDRAKAVCKFCDTDFVGGSKYEVDKLAFAVSQQWTVGDYDNRFVVLTGGEPALQYDMELWRCLKAYDFKVAMESNGTVPLKAPVDWLTVSPKRGSKIVLHKADELKVVFPQGDDPEAWKRQIEAFRHYIQPMDGPDFAANTQAAYEYVVRHPHWKLGIQMHKAVGVR